MRETEEFVTLKVDEHVGIQLAQGGQSGLQGCFKVLARVEFGPHSAIRQFNCCPSYCVNGIFGLL